MRSLTIAGALPATGSVLFIGAHCDDIEIGCGATVLGLVDAYPDATFHWVVLASSPPRAEEAEKAARAFLTGAEHVEIQIGTFRDGYLPYLGPAVKDRFEELKLAVDPDVIFTHSRHDAHQDHRLASELTWNTWRDHLIFEYEIPKYDGDLGAPNVFLDAPELRRNEKLRLLNDYYGSQRSRTWFSDDTFLGLMRLRGVEGNTPSGYAEAFYSRKLAIGL
jgi:LmbE family N-acetylglucosaminyl deacetylase